MNSVFILLNSLNDWKPYCETDSLMTVTDYLEHRYGERTPKLVINLSDEYGYNSESWRSERACTDSIWLRAWLFIVTRRIGQG